MRERLLRHEPRTDPFEQAQMSHKYILLQRQRMLTCLSYEIRVEALINQLKLHQLAERRKSYFNLSEGRNLRSLLAVPSRYRQQFRWSFGSSAETSLKRQSGRKFQRKISVGVLF
jgi:hypothetical protein